ncbi:MAG: hypothetical protein ABR999_10790 [Methanoregula sp.]|jgi:hypothetical protein|uniref:hypothetical protein n=1 Tax=Methanoregula sp. TaxID=2052170 RepID=UPI003D09EA7E
MDNYSSKLPGSGSLPSFVLSLLRQRGAGEDSALGAATLAGKATIFFGEPISGRMIRAVVRDLRRTGQPICSNNFGFFWPSNLHDVLATAELQFRGPARDELLTARQLRDAGRRLFGRQESFL